MRTTGCGIGTWAFEPRIDDFGFAISRTGAPRMSVDVSIPVHIYSVNGNFNTIFFEYTERVLALILERDSRRWFRPVS